MAANETIRFNVTTDFEKERINMRISAYAQAAAEAAKKETEKKG